MPSEPHPIENARADKPPTQAGSPSYASLSRVMGRLQALLSPAFDQRFWLRAELGQANERDGAFYGELIEVNRGGTIVAKVRCAILSRELQRIRARFQEAGLELDLQRGTVIGVQCSVQFHPVHGLSLLICDMDPSFVLGELELRRRRILTGLERDGLLGRNARCRLPLFPTRILLITSAAGAALHDFTRTLHGRKFGVQLWLADATMQGPGTESSVLRALALADKLPVDLVVLIRGGGSKLDLGWLDSDALARAVATLQRPVWTGIGHETDSSVLDHVAARAFRTPTAVAEALAAHFEAILRRLEDSEARMRRAYAATLELRLERLARSSHTLRHAPLRVIEVRRAELEARANLVGLRATTRVATARAAWVAQVDRMQRGASMRLVERHHQLGRAHERLSSSSARVLERKLAALCELARRLERLNLAERFVSERARLALQQRSLKQVAAQRVSEAHAALHASVRDTQTRTAAAIAQARLALAPKMQQLQATFRVRAQLTSARIAALQEQLTRRAQRHLQQSRERLTHTQKQFTQELVSERCARERSLLDAHSRVLRTSDPRRALELGYSITYAADGALVRSAAQLAPGQHVTTHVADGSFEAVVKTVGDNAHE